MANEPIDEVKGEDGLYWTDHGGYQTGSAHKSLQFNDAAAAPDSNTHVVQIERTKNVSEDLEQGGFVLTTGEEERLTAVWGKTSDGDNVQFYVDKDIAPSLEAGGTYAVTLDSNQQEPRHYTDSGDSARTFGVCRSQPVKLG